MPDLPGGSDREQGDREQMLSFVLQGVPNGMGQGEFSLSNLLFELTSSTNLFFFYFLA